jgi:hypothetical protein
MRISALGTSTHRMPVLTVIFLIDAMPRYACAIPLSIAHEWCDPKAYDGIPDGTSRVDFPDSTSLSRLGPSFKYFPHKWSPTASMTVKEALP